MKPFNLETRTPLWYYILKEAEVKKDGKTLGPVGGRIVAEVFVGVLQGDSLSFLRQDPDWTHTLGSGHDFKMTDLLRFAGVA